VAEAQAKHAGGRPSKYSPELADKICAALAEGKPMTKVAPELDVGLPTVYRWLAENPEFRDRYARAREDQADTLADDILSIADEDPKILFDEIKGEDVYRVDGAAVQHQRNRIEARKWIASKLKPKKYGERQQIDVDGSLTVAEADPMQVAQKLVTLATQHPTMNPVIRKWLTETLAQLPEIET
jgi:hypothetical protein